jgi:hypothetical protein
MLMKNFMVVALFASAALIGIEGAQAMPIAPLAQDPNPAVIQVYGGCGPGWHRGPYGGCRPLFNCPPGWHTGPYGRRCFRNW